MRRFFDERGNRGAIAFAVATIPLGHYSFAAPEAIIWLPSVKAYRQTRQFKKMIVESGVFDFWEKEGFPPFCRSLGSIDFECD